MRKPRLQVQPRLAPSAGQGREDASEGFQGLAVETPPALRLPAPEAPDMTEQRRAAPLYLVQFQSPLASQSRRVGGLVREQEVIAHTALPLSPRVWRECYS